MASDVDDKKETLKKKKKSFVGKLYVNRYESIRKLGSGNYGTAFLVLDKKRNDEKVVLKEIHIGELQPDETVDAVREAKLLQRLDHPGIVRFRDSFVDEAGAFCIVTEFCEGGDLDQVVAECRRTGRELDEELIVSWLIQLLLAAQYMHNRRVLHRDLKSRNIFLKGNKMIKVGDFGISRILVGTKDMASTFTGTPFYMSPEVLKHEGYDAKCDVWSIGCILYELCALRHAFEGQSLMTVMYRIVEGNVPPLPDRFSRELNEVFENLLTKDPSTRPTAAEALKLPFIVKHMERMKKDMMAVKTLTTTTNGEVTLKRETTEIARDVAQKSTLTDLRQMTHSPTLQKTQSSTFKNSQSTTLKDMQSTATQKTLTPTQLMRLRKIQKADAAGNALRHAAQRNLEDRQQRMMTMKQRCAAKDDPPWAVAEDDKVSGGLLDSSSHNVPLPRWARESSPPPPSPPVPPPPLPPPPRDNRTNGGIVSPFKTPTLRGADEFRRHSFDVVLRDDEGDRADERLEVDLGRRGFEDPGNTGFRMMTTLATQNDHAREDDLTLYRRCLDEALDSTKTAADQATLEEDSRVITPLRDRMVYNAVDNSLDFQGGVPEDPRIAETFYAQFDDFDGEEEEEEEEEEDYIEDRGDPVDEVPEEFDEEPLEDQLDDLIGFMEEALDLEDSVDQRQGAKDSNANSDFLLPSSDELLRPPAQIDEPLRPPDAFGPVMRETKIRNLTRRCKAALGDDEARFARVYDFLKAARSGGSSVYVGDAAIFDGLKELGANPADCFLVDQLLFLEEMATGSG